MRPKLGRIVYCIYEESIIAEPIYAIGKESFLLDFHDKVEDSVEYFYEDYNETWFTSLSKAKKKLLGNGETSTKLQVVKLSDYYYELREV